LKNGKQNQLLKYIPLFLFIFILLPGCFLVDNPYQPSPTPGSPADPSPTPYVSPNAIDFTLSDLDGNQYSLSEFRGKPVLVAFFGFLCSHCRNEMPRIQNLYMKYKESQNLIVLGVGVSSSIGQLREFQSKYGLTFPVLDDYNRDVYHQFFGSGIPALLLINKSGEVAYAYNQSELSEAEIENLLNSYIF
jgi:peroxiredoxin